MKRMLCGFVFLVSSMVWAQQGQPPPQSTPPIFPQGHSPREIPPDQEAPSAQRMSNVQGQQQIEQQLNSEASLSGTNVGVKTDDQSVVLTGTVDTRGQHDLALRIAQSSAGDRQVVDKIKVREHA